ncbi:MAG: (Fe-S)-binding protein [Desulfomonile sp.]
MASVVVLPDQDSFDLALSVLRNSGSYLQTLPVPEFCHGLTLSAILTAGSLTSVLATLNHFGITISGAIPFRPFKRDIPQAGPPEGKWEHILGGLRLDMVRVSISDPMRLRIELSSSKPFGYLIPIIARMIRGGAYRPEVPVLIFEEKHRLVALSSQTIVISRADDFLDFWLLLRCSVDLICSAWERRLSIEPDRQPRQGIGATEIFKRLPGTDCGKCGGTSCMEFAVSLLTRKSSIDQCVPLAEPQMARYRESLGWLMWTIGLNCQSESDGSCNVASSRVPISDIV